MSFRQAPSKSWSTHNFTYILCNFYFILLLALGSITNSYAGEAPAAAVSDSIDSTCPEAGGASAGGDGSAQQKQHYCNAAKGADEGSHADHAGYKIWAAVGVVCAHACAASYAGGPVSEYQCTGASISGGAADAVVTKNFASAMTGLGSASAGMVLNQDNAKKGAKAADEAASNDAPKAAEKKKDLGACVSAVSAAGQSYSKFSSMKNNAQAAKTNLDSAQSTQGLTQSAATAGGIAANNTGASQVGASGNGANGAGSARSTGSCGPRMSADAIIQCGISTDRNIPAFVGSPRFAKEFQKDAGVPLADFLTKDAAPGQLMTAGMSNGRASQGPKISASLDEIAQNAGAAPSSSTEGVYYTGGGGGAQESGEGSDDMAQLGSMMQGLMDQMNPNAKKEDTQQGVRAVIFANQNRSPAALAGLAEDRRLSLFDRVTYRYYFVGKRIVYHEPNVLPGPASVNVSGNVAGGYRR